MFFLNIIRLAANVSFHLQNNSLGSAYVQFSLHSEELWHQTSLFQSQIIYISMLCKHVIFTIDPRRLPTIYLILHLFNPLHKIFFWNNSIFLFYISHHLLRVNLYGNRIVPFICLDVTQLYLSVSCSLVVCCPLCLCVASSQSTTVFISGESSAWIIQSTWENDECLSWRPGRGHCHTHYICWICF